jgi:hypothetical protein
LYSAIDILIDRGVLDSIGEDDYYKHEPSIYALVKMGRLSAKYSEYILMYGSKRAIEILWNSGKQDIKDKVLEYIHDVTIQRTINSYSLAAICKVEPNLVLPDSLFVIRKHWQKLANCSDLSIMRVLFEHSSRNQLVIQWFIRIATTANYPDILDYFLTLNPILTNKFKRKRFNRVLKSFAPYNRGHFVSRSCSIFGWPLRSKVPNFKLLEIFLKHNIGNKSQINKAFSHCLFDMTCPKEVLDLLKQRGVRLERSIETRMKNYFLPTISGNNEYFKGLNTNNRNNTLTWENVEYISSLYG